MAHPPRNGAYALAYVGSSDRGAAVFEDAGSTTRSKGVVRGSRGDVASALVGGYAR